MGTERLAAPVPLQGCGRRVRLRLHRESAMNSDPRSDRFTRWFVISFAIVEAVMIAWFFLRRMPE